MPAQCMVTTERIDVAWDPIVVRERIPTLAPNGYVPLILPEKQDPYAF